MGCLGDLGLDGEDFEVGDRLKLQGLVVGLQFLIIFAEVGLALGETHARRPDQSMIDPEHRGPK